MKWNEEGPKLAEEDLNEAEQRIGRKIPPEYRAFLLEHNGGYPDESDFRMENDNPDLQVGTVDRFLGINVNELISIDYFVKAYKGRIPNEYFPLAQDPGGSVIVLATNGPKAGSVFFWDHEEESDDSKPSRANLYYIADSFGAFLRSLGS